MNKKIKRSIAAICAAAAVCTPLSTAPALSDYALPALTLTASAAGTISSGECSGYVYNQQYGGYKLYYKLTSTGAVITGCRTTKEYTEIAVPRSLSGKDVIAVDRNAFKDQTNITNISFYGINGELYQKYSYRGIEFYGRVALVGGSRLAEIGEGAFEGCKNLQYVNLGDKKVTIGDRVFYGCQSLEDVYFNSRTQTLIAPVYKEIGSYAFTGSGITEFSGITCETIKNHAFDGCRNLLSIDITADTVGYEAFNECTRLERINVTAKQIKGRCFQKCDFLRHVKIKADSIGTYCFSRSTNIGDAELDVAEIGTYAFVNCQLLNDLKLINTKTIGQHAFENCTGIYQLDIPDTVEIIGEFAFYKANNIRNPQIFIRENGQRLYIGRAAFNTSGVEYAVFKGNNITVGDYSFFQSRIKAAAVDGSVMIDHNAFGSGTSNPGFKIFGTADSNEYASDYGIPYEKVEIGKGTEKIMNDNKKYFMGISRFAELDDKTYKGSCAGISVMQLMAMTNKVDLSTILPAGKELIDVPGNAFTDHLPEYKTFTDMVVDYHSNQDKYYHPNAYRYLSADELEAYAKLTEYGITVPAALRINEHRHIITILGVEKLDPPRTDIEHGLDGTKKSYNYRLIVADSGYRYKLDENGNLLARGADCITYQPGWTEEQGWINAEDTYVYVSTEPSTNGQCYQQRWDHPQNVEHYIEQNGYIYDKILLSDIRYYPADTVVNK